MRKKLIITSILCLILPACFIIIFSSYLTKDVIKKQTITDEERSLDSAEMYISNLFNNMVNISNFIQFDGYITVALKDKRYEELKNHKAVSVGPYIYGQITDRINNVSTSQNNTYVTLLSESGESYSNYFFTSGFTPSYFSKQTWFEKLKQLPAFDIYWVGAEPTYLKSEQSNSPFTITLARTLKVTNDQTYAYLIVSISESQINQAFKHNGNYEEMMLVDREGKIISNQDSKKIGTFFPYMKDVVANKNIIQIKGNDYLLLNHPIIYNGYRLVSLVSYKQAVGQINTIHQVDFIVQIFIFCVFLALLIYMMNQFTKPIMRLGSIAAKVDAGNLEVRSHIRGRDEIGKLGQSFDHMLDRIKEMFVQITLGQTKKREAELAMLQAQIHPHFLFNILNSIRMRILLKHDEENAELIGSLSQLLRMTIGQNQEMVALHEEIGIVSHYVKLLNLRHKENIELSVQMTSDSMLIGVPRFIIQPIIENAFIHGLSQSSGTIGIESWIDNEKLVIKITDNGKGMSQEQLRTLLSKLYEPENAPNHLKDEKFAGIGLSNVVERLQILYGDAFAIQIESQVDQGTQITIMLPRH
jgi:two-component system sensor histidine kinase YesM